MSEVYDVTITFAAESDEQAERIRADLLDYILSRDVCDLAAVRPFRRLGPEAAVAFFEDAPTPEETA